MLTLTLENRTSCRELLSTAERIAQLDGQLQEAEANMATLSHNCNSETLNGLTCDAARLQEEASSQSACQYL